jgi:TonB family protein
MRTSLAFSLLLFFYIPLALKAQDPAEAKPSQQDADPKHHEVTPAHLISRVTPKYPKEARKQHVEGKVRLHAVIAKDGSIKNLEVISGDPLLVEAALKAVRQWRYSPMLINGRPAEVDTTIDVEFALNKIP